MMNKLIKWSPLAKQVQSHALIPSTINLSKIKRNELHQSNRVMIRHKNTGETKLTSTGKEKGRSPKLIQPTYETQTKIRV